MMKRTVLAVCLPFILAEARYVMYLTGQHPAPPSHPALVSDITHVALAFMPSSRFNQPPHLASGIDPELDIEKKWPLFTTVKEIRAKFEKSTKILVAIGGWGDDEGFEVAARTEATREVWAANVARMIKDTGADGVDIDWEYPGGNGEHYLQPNHTNPTNAWQITAYPQLLSTLRKHIPSSKLITAAVPGHPPDMLAFTSTTIPLILPSISFLNVMTYDLMNRRDTQTLHHAGIQASLRSIDAYLSRGVPPDKMNAGFAFYVKWYKTDTSSKGHKKCLKAWKNGPKIGCPTSVMEDPKTGVDLGRAGSFSWHDQVPSEVKDSFERARILGKWDAIGGGYCYWDEREDLWWSWENEHGIREKVEKVVAEKGTGGVFAWGLGEDGNDFVHLQTLTIAVRKLKGERRAHREL